MSNGQIRHSWKTSLLSHSTLHAHLKYGERQGILFSQFRRTMTNFSSEPESKHVVVLYDKRTGEIRHIHEEIFLEGSNMLNKQQIEDAAFKQVQTLTNRFKEEGMVEVQSIQRPKLAPLHVSHTALKPYANYRVDLKKKSLVEVREKQDNRK